MAKLPKIKRFGEHVEVGDCVKVCTKWEDVITRCRKSDGTYVTGCAYSEVFYDTIAETCMSFDRWQQLQGRKFEVVGVFKRGERLLIREGSGSTFPLSRLVIK